MGKLFFFGAEYLISQHGNEDGHEWRDDVEKAIWEVFNGWHFQNQRLGHTTGVPRHEYGGDGGGVLGGAAEETAFKAFFFI